MKAPISQTTRYKYTLRTVICTILVLVSPFLWALVIESAGKNAKISIVSPKNNAVISSETEIKLKAENTMLMPAGIVHPDSGHFHLLVNPKSLPKPGESVHSAALKLEKGQSSGTLKLAPGQYTLQAVLVDYLHRAHQPVVASEPISVTVVAPVLPIAKPKKEAAAKAQESGQEKAQ